MITETQQDNIVLVVGSYPEGGGSLTRTFGNHRETVSCMRGRMGGESCAEIFIRLGPKLILRVKGGVELHSQVKAIESYVGDRVDSALTELAESKLREESNDFVAVLNSSINEMHRIAYNKGRNSLRRDLVELMSEEFVG